METVIDKKVVHSCGHRGEINVVLTPRNEYAWRNLFERTPCSACLWIEVDKDLVQKIEENCVDMLALL